jgi:inner membrane transporter RhtA
VLPFVLEFLALRRLAASAFGTLMSLEPAIALLAGLVVLGQRPGLTAAAGVLLVVAAGVGATRGGDRGSEDGGDGEDTVPAVSEPGEARPSAHPVP